MSTARWTDEDKQDVEFYCLAAALLDVGLRSNFGAQMEAMEGRLDDVDTEEALVARMDAMERAAGVHRVLTALEAVEVRVLLTTFGRGAPGPVRAVFGDELAPLVMALATPAELRIQEAAPKLAADAALALSFAKQAYARARAARPQAVS